MLKWIEQWIFIHAFWAKNLIWVLQFWAILYCLFNSLCISCWLIRCLGYNSHLGSSGCRNSWLVFVLSVLYFLSVILIMKRTWTLIFHLDVDVFGWSIAIYSFFCCLVYWKCRIWWRVALVHVNFAFFGGDLKVSVLFAYELN